MRVYIYTHKHILYMYVYESLSKTLAFETSSSFARHLRSLLDLIVELIVGNLQSSGRQKPALSKHMLCRDIFGCICTGCRYAASFLRRATDQRPASRLYGLLI